MPPEQGHEIHVINTFRNADGGSEQEALTLYRQLSHAAPKGTTIKLWSNQPKSRISPALLKDHPIIPRSRWRPTHPRAGTLIFVGTGQRVHRWFERIRPARVILIYNLPGKEKLTELIQRSQQAGRPAEVVHVSRWMREASGIEGVIHYSPIDIQHFRPAARRNRNGFVVGRLSRDTWDKFSSADPSLFKLLAEAGCKIKIMGGTVLEPDLGSTSGVELLPVLSIPTRDFLHSLDCFLYRTNENWPEPFGRVVAEAMACGLPVVAENRGGYAELIEDGVDGFLFQTNDEAIATIQRLRDAPELAAAVGHRARKTMERMFGSNALQDRIDYYLQPTPVGSAP